MLDYGKRWTAQEDQELSRLHYADMLDIIGIPKIFPNRFPYTIVRRLLEREYISNFDSARGCTVYITPDYKEYMDELYRDLGGSTAYSN